MTSVDGLDNFEDNARPHLFKDEFLEYYQKHRPPGSVPSGYDFKPFRKMEHGTLSLPGSLYGEIGDNQFLKYRQSEPAAHNSTLSPSNSIAEDEDCEEDKPANFGWSTSSQISFGSAPGAAEISHSSSASKSNRPLQRKPLDRKTWYAKFLNSLRRSSSKKKGLPPSGHSLDTARNRYQQIDRSGTGETGIYRSESCRQMTSAPENEFGSCNSSLDEPLSGILGDKMKFGKNIWSSNNTAVQNHPSYSRSRCQLAGIDSFDNDCQSRDSGNSSGGTSSYNNARHRALTNAQRGQLPVLPASHTSLQQTSNFTENGVENRVGFGQISLANDASSTHHSIYSYTTARVPDDEDSIVGTSSTVSHYDGNWYGKRYDSQNTAYDTLSIASASAASSANNYSNLYDNRSVLDQSTTNSVPSWSSSQQNDNTLRQRRNPSLSWIASSSASGTFYSAKVKRKLDSLDEDDTSSFEIESNTDGDNQIRLPSRKRQCSPFKKGLEPANNIEFSLKTLAIQLICRLLHCLWKIAKFCVMAVVVVITILGLFYALRSYTCNIARDSKMDIPFLRKQLGQKVFGQPYAIDAVTKAIDKVYENVDTAKVLVLLLVGSTGTGKTLTSSIVRQHFPVSSSNSYFFSVPMHFHSQAPDGVDILWDVASHIQRNCGYSLVLFDDLETEMIGSNVEAQNETLRQIINFASNLKNNIYGDKLNSVLSKGQTTNSNGTIILITTGAGGEEINYQTVEMTRISPAGTIPQATQLDMNKVIKSSSILEYFQHMLENRGVALNVIPFMPLSRGVVRKCIINDIQSRFPDHDNLSPQRKVIDNLLQELKYFSEDFPVFSTAGCKSITSKLDILLEGIPNPSIAGLVSDGF